MKPKHTSSTRHQQQSPIITFSHIRGKMPIFSIAPPGGWFSPYLVHSFCVLVKIHQDWPFPLANCICKKCIGCMVAILELQPISMICIQMGPSICIPNVRFLFWAVLEILTHVHCGTPMDEHLVGVHRILHWLNISSFIKFG